MRFGRTKMHAHIARLTHILLVHYIMSAHLSFIYLGRSFKKKKILLNLEVDFRKIRSLVVKPAKL